MTAGVPAAGHRVHGRDPESGASRPRRDESDRRLGGSWPARPSCCSSRSWRCRSCSPSSSPSPTSGCCPEPDRVRRRHEFRAAPDRALAHARARIDAATGEPRCATRMAPSSTRASASSRGTTRPIPSWTGSRSGSRFGIGDTRVGSWWAMPSSSGHWSTRSSSPWSIVPLQGGLALLLALLINSRMRGVNIFRTIYFVPVVMSMVVVSLLWRFIYSPRGPAQRDHRRRSRSARSTGGLARRRSAALPAVMLMSMWQAVGFQMVIWLAGLQTIPDPPLRGGGARRGGRWAQFKHVTWPGLRNTAVFVFITITIAAFGLFTQIDVMTRGGPARLRPRRSSSRPSNRASASRTSPTDRRSRSCSSCIVLSSRSSSAAYEGEVLRLMATTSITDDGIERVLRNPTSAATRSDVGR